jgi:hypothetical protein
MVFKKINNLNTSIFKSFNEYRKACKFTGTQYALKTGLNLANVVSIVGSAFPLTVYLKFLFLGDTGTSQLLFRLGNPNVTGSNVNSIELFIARKNSTTFTFYLQCGKTSFVIRETLTTFLFSEYTNKYMEVIFRIHSATGYLQFYLNNSPYTTTSLGTIPHPSTFIETDYRISIGGRKYDPSTFAYFLNAYLLDVAVFKKSYNSFECLTNMSNATFRLKCNEDSGYILNNTGTLGSNLNLSLLISRLLFISPSLCLIVEAFQSSNISTTSIRFISLIPFL